MKIGSKNFNILLSCLIIAICAIAGFLLVYFYISNYVYSYVYMDEPRIIVELYENTDNLRHITFNSLFVSYSGHLTFGTYLILLLQLNTFGLQNGIYLTYSILAFLLIIYFVICLSFSKIVDFYIPKVVIFSLIASFLLFSTKQWETIWFSYGSIIYLSNALFLVSFLLISIGLVKHNHFSLYVGNIVGFAAAFLFGSGYSFGFIVAIIICEAFALFLNAKERPYKINIIVSEVLNIGFLIFLFIGVFNGSSTGIVSSLYSFGDLVIGYIYSLSSCICEITSPSWLRIFVGVVVLLFSLLSLFLFFKKKMYKKTYLPILCLAFSQLIHFSTLLSRFSLTGVEGAVASRYYSTYILGFIGSIYVFLDCSFEKFSFKTKSKIFSKNNIFGLVNAAILIFLCTNQFIFYNNENGIAVYRRANAIAAERNVYFTDVLSDEQIYADYQTNPDIYRKYVDIIRANKLYVYDLNLPYSNDMGKNTFDTPYSIGAFEIEPGNKRYISKETCFVTKNSVRATEKLTVYNPASFKENKISVFINKTPILSDVIIKKDEVVQFTINYPVGINTITIHLAKENKPHGEDIRTLGVLLEQKSFVENGKK